MDNIRPYRQIRILNYFLGPVYLKLAILVAKLACSKEF